MEYSFLPYLVNLFSSLQIQNKEDPSHQNTLKQIQFNPSILATPKK